MLWGKDLFYFLLFGLNVILVLVYLFVLVGLGLLFFGLIELFIRFDLLLFGLSVLVLVLLGYGLFWVVVVFLCYFDLELL